MHTEKGLLFNYKEDVSSKKREIKCHGKLLMVFETQKVSNTTRDDFQKSLN